MHCLTGLCGLIKGYIRVFRETWEVRKSLDTPYRQEDEHAFLPAHLELIETPVSALPRWIGRLIILFLLTALCWSYFGKVEIVAVATGKILPSGRSKIIQPIETAIVKQSYVRNGQVVKKGELLLELTTLGVESDLSKAKSALKLASLNQLRQEAILLAIQENTVPQLKNSNEQVTFNIEDRLFKGEQQLALSQYLTWVAEKQKLSATILQKETEKKTINIQIQKLIAMLKHEKERRNDIYGLYKKGHVSKHEYFSQENRVIELENEKNIQQSKIYELEAQLEQVHKEYKVFEQSFQRNVLDELRKANEQVEQFILEVEKSQQRQTSSKIYAPVDGTVQQLQTYTIGGVVTTAQPLMTIVPQGEQFEIEAMLSNKDIGFVNEGQDVTIKVEAFPYTRYGYIKGKVKYFSFEAIQDEKLGLVFPVTILMDKSYLNIDGRSVELIAGMAVSAEIKTGERRVIDYLLSPLKTTLDESFKER
ncbi:hemolysin D [Bisgaardia hudsonensis]|uniref:Membrane fusion protein (MFP) family protein n=1 Tax=Bisgaardia hudsonensis TaxID=109472 RepID=A0A4R2N331_9PAST|nr:HlyD family type I secretion periplasmic adaptor subunit [Bisgaardia hudsonensis]QLB12681.1 hemolysin D [Bisgaardia hudsonensis]TCP14229.1 hemolysin D [Bisgaardia hudsonensis]